MSSELYTEVILELYKHPMNRGTIEGADIVTGGGNPACGDQATFYLKVKDGMVEDIKFNGTGCAISVPCVSPSERCACTASATCSTSSSRAITVHGLCAL